MYEKENSKVSSHRTDDSFCVYLTDRLLCGCSVSHSFARLHPGKVNPDKVPDVNPDLAGYDLQNNRLPFCWFNPACPSRKIYSKGASEADKVILKPQSPAQKEDPLIKEAVNSGAFAPALPSLPLPPAINGVEITPSLKLHPKTKEPIIGINLSGTF